MGGPLRRKFIDECGDPSSVTGDPSCDPSTQKTEAGVLGQPGLKSELLPQKTEAREVAQWQSMHPACLRP